MSTSLPPRRRRLPGSPFTDPAPRVVEDFAIGDRVSHDLYGLGSVVGIEEGIAVHVDFSPDKRRITWPYAKLAKL